MATYWERELGKLALRYVSEDTHKVKITTGNTETRWLSLTPEQFEKLEAFMLTIEEDGEL